MKANRLIVALVCLFIGFTACAQSNSTGAKAGKQTEVLVPGFKLFPTTNMWTFIMLDEVDGRTWQVQWSTDGKEGIVPINAGATL